MKRQIHAYRGHDEIAVEGHNIKLGRGGIREIEFFVQTQQLDRRRPPSRAARPRDADDARRARARAAGSTAEARDDLDAAYRLSAHGRAPAADGGRRADPHAAGRPRRARALRALSPASRTAMPSPRRCSAICARCSATTARCSRPRRRAPTGRRSPFPRTRTIARRSDRLGALGFRAAAGGLGDGAPLACRRPSLAARRLRARAACANWCRCCSSDWRAPRIRTRRWRLRPLPRRTCAAAARLFSLLQQNPDPRRAGRADARHRAAACRHPGALSGSRSTRCSSRVLRRAAGRSQARGRARSARSAQARYDEDFLDRLRMFGAGADVPDRRAHPVRHGVGASRPARPSPASPTW